jgi:hypothetical protein
MARKKKLSLNDWSRIPVQPAKSAEGYETREQFYAREEREARERAEAPIRRIVTETQAKLSAALAEHSAKIAKFWRNISVESLEDYIRHGDALIDDLGLPTTETPFSMSAFEARVIEFVESLPALGVTFNSDAARRKFVLYAFTQADQGTAIDTSSLTAMLERCMTVNHTGIFKDGEVTGELVKAVAQPAEPEKSSVSTWDAVSTLSTERREERKKVLAAVGEDFTSEVAAFFGLWLDQLQRDYAYAMPSDVVKKALAFVTERNLNPLRHETYNIVRRTFTKCGWMPAGMLTERERLDDLIESSDVHDRDTRRAIALKHREILDAEPPLVPHK